MNAFPMIAECAARQPAAFFVVRCDCGEPMVVGTGRCATCALRENVLALERAWPSR
jgi:hypothetical protein